jgi:hypothetical protein
VAEKSIADFEIVADRKELFVRVGGETIAKRGQPGTPHAGTWIILEPGYTVFSKGDEIVVERNDAGIQ